MLLSCSTNTFGGHSLDQALEGIAEAGYSGVELLADRPHASPPFSGTKLTALRQRLDRKGLKVVNINANTAKGAYRETHPAWEEESLFGPSLCDARRGVREERIRHALGSLELADALGAPSMCVTSGRAGTGNPPEEAMKWLRESLGKIMKRAADLGVRVGLEYEPGLLVESAREARDLLKRIGSPWLGVNFDVGHAVVGGEPLVATIESLGTSVVHVHVEDIRDRKHYHRVPGDGDIRWVPVLAALRNIGYGGGVTVELYPYAHRPHAAARQAYRFLAPLIRKNGAA